MTRIKQAQLLLPFSNPFSYGFPQCLSVQWGQDLVLTKASVISEVVLDKLGQRGVLGNFFSRLNYLNCRSCTQCLGFIPVDVLFNKKSNFYGNDESREYIEKFCISETFGTTDDCKKIAAIEQFYQGLVKYTKHGMRKIKCFEFTAGGNGYYWYGMENNNWKMPNAFKKLILFLSNISQSVDCECINNLEIEDLNEMKMIFHKNLKNCYFNPGNIICNCKQGMIEEIEMSHGTLTDEHDWAEANWAEASWVGGNSASPSDSNVKVLDFLDKFEMRKHIKKYTLNCCGDDLFSQDIEFLNKLFFKDYKKHPLLEKIIFKIRDKNHLNFVFEYLISHKQELFVQNKVKKHLKYFKTIELQITTEIKVASLIANNDIQHGEYLVDEKVITIATVNQHVACIKQKMVCWINRINAAKQSTCGRSLVLFV